ncbi:MAG: ComEC/Rec2 family competence protein [Oscillospiraceae bacterium]
MIEEKKIENNEPLHLFKRNYLLFAVIVFGLSNYTALNFMDMKKFNLSASLIYSLTFFVICILLLNLLKAIPSINPHTIRIFRLCIIFSFIFMLGIFRIYHYEIIRNSDFKSLEGMTTNVYGRITQEPELSKTGKTRSTILDVSHIYSNKKISNVNGKMKLYINTEFDEVLHKGDIISCYTELSVPDEMSHANGFDQKKYMFQNDCYYTGFAKNVISIPTYIRKKNTLPRTIDSIRNSLISSVDNTLHDTNSAALLKGILIGETNDISDEDYTNLSRSGFVHIASVSGLHVMYLFLMLSKCFGLLRLKKRFINIFAIPILIIFAAMAYFSTSVCRATIMMIIFLMAFNFGREPNSLAALALSALILILSNPYTLFNLGFILSFSATFGILIFSSPIENIISHSFKNFIKPKSPYKKPIEFPNILKKFGNYTKTSIAITLASSVGIVFFIAYTFNIVSLSGLFANLWVLPCTCIVFILGYINWGIAIISTPLAEIIAKFLITPFLNIITKTAETLADSIFILNVPTPTFFMFLLYAAFFYIILYSLHNQATYIKNEIDPETEIEE